MGETQAIGASDFKARCLDRIASRTLTGVTITKRGKIVGMLARPDLRPSPFIALFQFAVKILSPRHLAFSNKVRMAPPSIEPNKPRHPADRLRRLQLPNIRHRPSGPCIPGQRRLQSRGNR